MKKALSVFMSAVALLGLCACNQGGKDDGGNGSGGGTIVDSYVFQEREIKSDGSNYPDGPVPYPDELWETPEWEYCPDIDFGRSNGVDVSSVKGIYFTSPVKYRGKKTKVCAYLGFPEGASAENKVPAIVLVHGGLGTAFPDWVKYWNDQGFAAISLDTEGAEPIEGISNYSGLHNQENRYKDDETYTNGPTNSDFSDAQYDFEDQWFYHATSATIVACSLISSFDCVDVQKIGITGISWGGRITCNVICYDDRFSFAMPIYNVMAGSEANSSQAGTYTGTNGLLAKERWDNVEHIKHTNCKVFNVNSTTDLTTMNCNTITMEACGGMLLYKKTFPHGQNYGAEEPNLPFFARYFCGMEGEFLEVIHNPTMDDLTLKLRPYGDVEINKISIQYTMSERLSQNTQWKGRSVAVEEGKYEYEIKVPDGCKFFYVQITYNMNLEVSTYVVTVK